MTAAQSNWALLPGPDSLVATPLEHLREVAAFRIVRDVQVSKYRAEVIERTAAAVDLNNAVLTAKQMEANARLESGLLRTELNGVNADLKKAERRSKGWKTACMVFSGIAAVTTGFIVAK